MNNLISNFSHSLLNHIQSGFKQVDSDTKQARLEICKTCDQYDSSLIRCNNCGCFLLIKAAWASEDCPLKKWSGDISIQEEISIPSEIKETIPVSSDLKDCGCNKK